MQSESARSTSRNKPSFAKAKQCSREMRMKTEWFSSKDRAHLDASNLIRQRHALVSAENPLACITYESIQLMLAPRARETRLLQGRCPSILAAISWQTRVVVSYLKAVASSQRLFRATSPLARQFVITYFPPSMAIGRTFARSSSRHVSHLVSRCQAGKRPEKNGACQVSSNRLQLITSQEWERGGGDCASVMSSVPTLRQVACRTSATSDLCHRFCAHHVKRTSCGTLSLRVQRRLRWWQGHRCMTSSQLNTPPAVGTAVIYGCYCCCCSLYANTDTLPPPHCLYSLVLHSRQIINHVAVCPFPSPFPSSFCDFLLWTL